MYEPWKCRIESAPEMGTGKMVRDSDEDWSERNQVVTNEKNRDYSEVCSDARLTSKSSALLESDTISSNFFREKCVANSRARSSGVFSLRNSASCTSRRCDHLGCWLTRLKSIWKASLLIRAVTTPDST